MAETDWQVRHLDKLDRDVAALKAEFRAAEARIGVRIDQFLGSSARCAAWTSSARPA